MAENVKWKEDRSTPGRIITHIYDTATQCRQYVAWAEIEDDEVLQRVWSYRRTKKYGVEYTEVIRKVTNNGTWYRNMYFCGTGGWQVVYEPKDISKYYYGYETTRYDGAWFNVWDWAEPTWFKGWYNTLNIDEVFKGTKYEFCGYVGGDLIDYLERWEKDSWVEMFGKIGIYPEKSYIRKCGKDPEFCRFLREHRTDASHYGPKATIYAYDHKMEIREARDELEKRREILEYIPLVKMAKLDPLKVWKYIKRTSGYRAYAAYNDYLRAVLELKLDLKNTKITFPRDFQAAHDMRIEEYSTLMRRRDEEKRKKDNEAFRASLEKFRDKAEAQMAGWCIILPASIFDLVNEGDVLHHCVGRMGYDKKVINGQSVIAFMRPAGKPDVPYITIEYGISQKKVLQAHGDKNSNPTPNEWETIRAWESIMAGRQRNDKL